mmetsp:Transcript_47994/g.63534  ORF Transcript_47994/g.63534 Transcript_47994/m.63534 type:complete len:425 (+) Transcript_47994:2203-3477(+)|eukprot:CAMPEP_0185567938 /NCGR_PEP_ID=MMETSP0434-20130131/1052_1 /TAXON_ID=626734 ORGANISM="Favella taraikaensis, Strain Fe Narragansett Bay" /NCGR_SAMPLE_ID=MMETSP0434 /ASSEMBLY_ACC=CAM_ASM_000379 /LENGTH=424 /DNA_ID=CAMNT_0028182295 /DNA_START=2196 /DNA_END=3470 /DNA_ORIENTATION=-
MSALLVQSRHDMRVVLAVLLRALSIVEVNQHVRQTLVQSIFDLVIVLLCLTALLLVALSVLLIVLLGGGLRVLSSVAVVLLLLVLVLSTLCSMGLPLVILGVAIGGLLVPLGLSRLVLVCGTRLTIMRRVCRLSVLSPLVMLFFDLFTDIIFVAFLWAVDALLFSVLILALFFAFFIVGFARAHVFSDNRSARLRLPGALDGGSLRSLRLLLLVVLALILIDQVVHRHHWLLTVWLLALMVLAFMVLGTHGLIGWVPLARLSRACLLVHRCCRFLISALLALCTGSLILLGESLHILSSCGGLLLRIASHELLLRLLLLGGTHVDDLDGLTDVELRLDHSRVILHDLTLVVLLVGPATAALPTRLLLHVRTLRLRFLFLIGVGGGGQGGGLAIWLLGATARLSVLLRSVRRRFILLILPALGHF